MNASGANVKGLGTSLVKQPPPASVNFNKTHLTESENTAQQVSQKVLDGTHTVIQKVLDGTHTVSLPAADGILSVSHTAECTLQAASRLVASVDVAVIGRKLLEHAG